MEGEPISLLLTGLELTDTPFRNEVAITHKMANIFMIVLRKLFKLTKMMINPCFIIDFLVKKVYNKT